MSVKKQTPKKAQPPKKGAIDYSRDVRLRYMDKATWDTLERIKSSFGVKSYTDVLLKLIFQWEGDRDLIRRLKQHNAALEQGISKYQFKEARVRMFVKQIADKAAAHSKEVLQYSKGVSKMIPQFSAKPIKPKK